MDMCPWCYKPHYTKEEVQFCMNEITVAGVGNINKKLQKRLKVMLKNLEELKKELV